ncbi:hypothetical protein IHE44_0009866 [Lamprotornis superbus]|uniref:RBR-type E3 ubiquitin transferase n=1 Tax=Lamprotornis superbus TaxID=245042 RepID=A0A835TQN2_9PASS|nr:hypothetical protein IHE44_0009866 [Lamprotornis superbus]
MCRAVAVPGEPWPCRAASDDSQSRLCPVSLSSAVALSLGGTVSPGKFCVPGGMWSHPVLGRAEQPNSSRWLPRRATMDQPTRVPGPRRLLGCFRRKPQAVGEETPPEPEPEPEEPEETPVVLPLGEGQVLEECPLCLLPQPPEAFPSLASCSHRSCWACLQQYLCLAVRESRVPVSCPHCPAALQPSDVHRLLPEPALRDKYEEFLLRRLLVADPGTRWCPAPDCRYRRPRHRGECGVGPGPASRNSIVCLCPVSPSQARFLITLSCVGLGVSREVYAVFAHGCAECPRLTCGREGCGTEFCYHCRQPWHPDGPCAPAPSLATPTAQLAQPEELAHGEALAQGGSSRAGVWQSMCFCASCLWDCWSQDPEFPLTASAVVSWAGMCRGTSAPSMITCGMGRAWDRLGWMHIILSYSPILSYLPPAEAEDIKVCPRCSAFIMKINDGSCNRMNCTVCGCLFCWLCLREISDVHFLSPSGCTFWGKRPWSRTRRILWQLGMVLGAPMVISLAAGVAVPVITIGIPIYMGRKVLGQSRRSSLSRCQQCLSVTSSVLLSLFVSPIITALTVGIGVPLVLTYVYGTVVLSLCRSRWGCRGSRTPGDLGVVELDNLAKCESHRAGRPWPVPSLLRGNSVLSVPSE